MHLPFLVQDPYGNYVRRLIYFGYLVLTSLASKVVQYILDLNNNRFSDAVIRQFTWNVCALFVQKFSSNVIEKVNHASNFQALTDSVM